MASGHTSWYRTSAGDVAARAPLRGAQSARVAVVGGGYAGLNTALGLAERGERDVLLLEAAQVGHGASGRNGGFVFGGFSEGEDGLLRQLGPARARALYAGTQRAVDRIRSRVARYAIDCELVDAGVLWCNWFRDARLLRERQALMAEAFGVEWDYLDAAALRARVDSPRYHGALFEPNAMHFQPLRYARGLADAAAAAGVRLHEDSPATALEAHGSGWRLRTPEGEVDCEHVVLACGGYLAGLRRDVDAAVLPIATYVMATEPLGPRLGEVLRTQAAVYDTRFAFDYYRPLADTRLLWGGRISVLDRQPADVARLLLRDLRKVFPQLGEVRVAQAWSGLMSYARHSMPQLGRIAPGLWVAQAFGGHGVAPTTLAGEVLAEAIAGGDDRELREFSSFGLVPAFKPAGFAAAQLTYWWLQARDAWRAARGG